MRNKRFLRSFDGDDDDDNDGGNRKFLKITRQINKRFNAKYNFERRDAESDRPYQFY